MMPHSATRQTYAILMGDLVTSERHANPASLYDRFNDAIARANVDHAADLASPLTITLGDEFQGLATSLVAAAFIARTIRYRLMDADIDCRFSIGLAALATPLNTDRAWNMMGHGLAAARERLDEKRANNLYRFSLPNQAALETLLEASGATLTAIERKWSDIQRRDIVALLAGEVIDDVAARRNVTTKNIYKTRAAGDYDLYLTQWDAIRTALRTLDECQGLPGAARWSTRSFIPA
jgi:hypothetical protein